MLLHALQDDYNLNALADTKRGTESLTFMNFVYMTDPQGNRLTDPQGNYLVGIELQENVYAMTLQSKQDDLSLVALPFSHVLHAGQTDESVVANG